MKYFIGTTKVIEGTSTCEAHALFVASSEAQARALLVDRTSMFGGDDGEPGDGLSWRFMDGEIVCSVGCLREISPVAYQDLLGVFPTFGDAKTGELSEDNLSENVKTLTHRLGTQLKRYGAPVPHTKLLNAVAASVGETDWAVVHHKKVIAPTMPDGILILEETMAPTGEYAKYRTIEGYVDEDLVISMSNHIQGKWHVGSSMAWVGPLDRAERYHICATEVMRRAQAYAKNQAA